MEHRIKELDYLKSIFILLMIVFHLVYIGDKYPYIKQIVYTFHMSAFLIISGYLDNVQKDIRSFVSNLCGIHVHLKLDRLFRPKLGDVSLLRIFP